MAIGDRAILFTLVAAIAVLVASVVYDSKSELEKESELLLEQLTADNELSLLSSDEVTEEKIAKFDQMNYDELKTMLGVQNDFCVYFEDQEGNVVTVTESTGIGSHRILINGEPCD